MVGNSGIDGVLGVVYLKNVVRRVYNYLDAEHSGTVGDLVRPASFVPGSKPASELLRGIQLWHSHLVTITNELGGIAGLCTMRDIVEEIAGKTINEYSHEIPAVVELPESRCY